MPRHFCAGPPLPAPTPTPGGCHSSVWRGSGVFLGLTSSPFICSRCNPHCFLLWAAVFLSPCRSCSRNRLHVTAGICRADSCWKPSCQTGPNQTLWNNVVELIHSERNINYLPLICFIPAQLLQKTYLVLTTCQAVPWMLRVQTWGFCPWAPRPGRRVCTQLWHHGGAPVTGWTKAWGSQQLWCELRGKVSVSGKCGEHQVEWTCQIARGSMCWI